MLIIKADQRAWLCRSRSRRGSLRRPVIKASARCLCPAGQPTSITAAPVNRGRQPRPQCPARHLGLQAEPRGTRSRALVGHPPGETSQPHFPPPSSWHPGETLTSVGGDRPKTNNWKRACTGDEVRGYQLGPQLRCGCASPGPLCIPAAWA